MTKPFPLEIQHDCDRVSAAEKRLVAVHLQHEAALLVGSNGSTAEARESAHRALDELLDAKEAFYIGVAKARREGRLA